MTFDPRSGDWLDVQEEPEPAEEKRVWLDRLEALGWHGWYAGFRIGPWHLSLAIEREDKP